MSGGHKTPLDAPNKNRKIITRKAKFAGKKLTYKTQKLGKDICSYVIETKANIESKKKRWYSVIWIYHTSGWSAEDNKIFEKANDMHIVTGMIQMQGERFAFVRSTEENVDRLVKAFGNEYAYSIVDKSEVWMIQ